jgi:UDP:flavonoid glycosyltransferase YjiC (YdhE family)
MAAAFAAGIPQLVVPFNFDQPDNGARMQALGAGAVIRPSACAAATLARTLDQLLASPAVQDTCRSIAGRMRFARPVAAACDLIEATARNSVHLAATAQAS